MKTIFALLIVVWSVSAMAETNIATGSIAISCRCNNQYGHEINCQTMEPIQPIDPGIASKIAKMVYAPCVFSQTDINFLAGGTEVLVFKHDGDVIWRGHKIESDVEFKAAIIDFVRYINNPAGYVPQSSK